MTTATLPAADQPVSVEWSRLSSVVSGGSRQATADDVLHWIKTSPLRTRLRVHLEQRMNDQQTKQLRRRLQSMGCTVTSLTTFAADR